jgi:hypothetical protein
MVGSDYYPRSDDVSADTSAADDPALSGIDPITGQPKSQSWLKKLAALIAGQGKPQTATQTQQQATQAQQAATKNADPGTGAGATATPPSPAGAKAVPMATTDPAAIAKGEHAQRQSQAIGSLAHSAGEIVKMLAGAYAGGGGIPASTGTGAATSIPAGSTETFTAGGGDTGLVSGGGGFGGGSTGGGLSQLASNYFGGGGGGGGTDYSSILKLLQGGGGGGGGGGGSPGGGGGGGGLGGGMGGGGQQQQLENYITGLTSGKKRTAADAQLAGLGQGLTGASSIPIPWAT